MIKHETFCVCIKLHKHRKIKYKGLFFFTLSNSQIAGRFSNWSVFTHVGAKGWRHEFPHGAFPSADPGGGGDSDTDELRMESGDKNEVSGQLAQVSRGWSSSTQKSL